MSDYEHTPTLREAEEAIVKLRRCIRRLHWIAGGEGYDNMGKRELEQARNRAASGSLNAGGNFQGKLRERNVRTAAWYQGREELLKEQAREQRQAVDFWRKKAEASIPGK